MSPVGVAGFRPFLAALVVLAVTEGKPDWRGWTLRAEDAPPADKPMLKTVAAV